MFSLKSTDHDVRVSPSIVVYAIAFALLVYFVFYVRTIMVMLFGAVIIMSSFNPAVARLEKKLKVPRIIGILLMYSLFISAISLALAVIVPPLINQMQQLAKYAVYLPQLEELKNFRLTASGLNGFLDSFGGSVMTVAKIITSTFSGVFTVFTVLVMSSYLLIDRNNLYKKIGWFTNDKRYFDLAKEFVDSAESQLGGWVRGQVILMTVIGLATYAGLSLLGVPYAVPLAILAGLLEVLPNLGPTIAAVPAILLAFVYGSWPLAGFTTLFYIVMQQLENNFIVPKIMKDNADVNPLATIITILIGLQVAGIIGALLAVPAYIILRSAYSMWRREQK